jgi:hypothetical protein
MASRALDTARNVTVTLVAAAAVGTAGAGVHLATDHDAARAVGGTSASRGTTDSTPSAPTETRSSQGRSFLGGFGQVLAPLNGGGGASHSSSHGS